MNVATDTVSSDISLCNRVAMLQSEDDQDLFTDSGSQFEFSNDTFQCTASCFGKALSHIINQDTFDKIVLKKVDQEAIVQAKSCDDYVRCKS